MPRRALLLLLAGLVACGAPEDPTKIRVFSDDAVLLELPYVAQETPNLCGLAAAQMLTLYHQRELTPAAARALRTEAGAEGVTGRTLKKALEDSGYTVHVFRGGFAGGVADVREHLDKGRPVIVMLGQEPARHYCLLTGYDTTGGLMAILDPLKGPRAVESGDFDRAWELANHFTLLALPRDEVK